MAVKVGDVVLIDEPFSYVLNRECQGQLCDYCLQRKPGLLRCSRCKFVSYCNKECQVSAWKLDHKPECGHLKKSSSGSYPSDFVRIMSKVIVKLQRDGDEEFRVNVAGKTRTFRNIMDHWEDIVHDQVRWADVQFRVTKLVEFMFGGGRIEPPPFEDLARICCKLMINCHDIGEANRAGAKPIGFGLYLGASIIDHSCDPNAIIAFRGPVAYVEATQPIQKVDLDSNVFINYVEVLAPAAERRKHTMERFYFVCNCPLCQNEDADMLMTSLRCENRSCDEPQLIAYKCGSIKTEPCRKSGCGAEPPGEETIRRACLVMDSTQSDCEDILRQDPQERIEVAEEILKKQEPLLHPLNVYHVRVLTIARDVCVNLKEWDKAVVYVEKVLDAYRRYGNNHETVTQLAASGKMKLMMGNTKGALSDLEEAFSMMTGTYSTTYNIYMYVKRAIKECNTKLKSKRNA